MGAKPSKRSVDITTTPKKGEGDNPVEGEGKVEKIVDLEAKVTTNGAIHTEIEYADKEEDEKQDEPIKENGVSDSEGGKTPEGGDVTSADQQLNESGDNLEKSGDSAEKTEDSDGNKKNKEKGKKKKWSFRSISFSKKDKAKPSKDSEKNGDVKEVTEEMADENAASPGEDTSKAEGEKKSGLCLINGESSPEAVKDSESADIEKAAQPEKEEVKAVSKPEVEVPKTEVLPAPATETSTKEEEVKPPVEEPKASESVIEESKEVRSEELPPPLPTTNPPSPVSVFAESTAADALTADQVLSDAGHSPKQSLISASIVETIPEAIPDSIIETIPVVAVSSPITESIPEHVSPVVESISAQSPIKEDTSASSISITNTTEPIVENILEVSTLPVETTILEQSVQNNVSLSPVNLPEPMVEQSISDPVACLSESAKEAENIITETNDFLLSEPLSSPIKQGEVAQEESLPRSVSVPSENITSSTSEQVVNADSLPDISTESLPSLPEPCSESLPEPMSLPPIECVPEPIINESLPEPIPNIPMESEKVPESITDTHSLPHDEMVLTNGDANGLPSPTDNEVMQSTDDHPAKQVPAASEILAMEHDDQKVVENKIEAVESAVVKAE